MCVLAFAWHAHPRWQLVAAGNRGALLSDFLSGAGPRADPFSAELTEFNPFNLIVADRDRASFLSNHPETIRSTLAPGIYGLSNGALDEPWPKSMRLKASLLDWIVRDVGRPEVLLDALRDDTMPDVGVRVAAPSDVPQEPRLSPIFIRNPVYGTRCSTVVAIDTRGNGVIVERRYSAAGEAMGETAHRFSWAAASRA